ncbi:MAG TPA: hypothetical protein VF577_03450 [Allosphingosinicella sp.]|jgi:hypothetical protein
MELFRREALDGQDRLHGDIVFVPRISWRLLGAFFSAAVAAAALYLLTYSYRPATPVTGRLAMRDGALVAAFEVPAAAIEEVAVGQELRLSPAGIAGSLDARVSAVTPAGDGAAVVVASLNHKAALQLRSGTTVRTALAGRPRTLAAWLYHSLFGSERP